VELRGISYSIDGVGDPRRDLEVIRDELHCTTVLLYGKHIGRLRATATTARGLGLDTFVRLKLLRLLPRLQPRVTRKLDALLAEAAAIARQNFQGPVTYAAAFWERVDWSRFDLVGVNLYRFGGNEATYADQVRALAGSKPVVITEFGCCTYLRELVDVYEQAGVHGAFVFTFAMPDFPHRPDDPAHDLDMAGFGVVKVAPDDPSRWERKAAFHELGRLYGR
jgi:hypothetical protein